MSVASTVATGRAGISAQTSSITALTVSGSSPEAQPAHQARKVTGGRSSHWRCSNAASAENCSACRKK